MKTKDRRLEAAPVPMFSARKHGRLQRSCGEEKRCIVPMISAGKHGRLQESVVKRSGA